MIAQNGLISIHISSRGVSKTASKGEIEGDWFETNVGIRVFLANRLNNIVIELLKLDSLSNSWQE